MKDTFYLVCTVKSVFKLSHAEPELKIGERAVLLEIEIPDAYFKPPVPRVTITIPEETQGFPSIRVVVPDAQEFKERR